MMVKAYYNEIDPYAVQWLRNLIKAGHIANEDVDERSVGRLRAYGNAIDAIAAQTFVSAFMKCP